MRQKIHMPLTPVGTPESKPRSAESVHKTSSAGKTIDIMILPRSAPEQDRAEEKAALPVDAEERRQTTTEEPVRSDGTIAENIDAGKTEFEGKGMTGSEFLANLPEGISACPFLEHGCHKVGEDMDVKRHIRDDRVYHLMILCRALVELRRLRFQAYMEWPKKMAEIEGDLMTAFITEKKYGDQCLFCIKNIDEVILKSRDPRNNMIFSQPFETHRYGYKMTLIVAPFGDAAAARRYLSVYLTIMKGEYDAILRWPFSFPLTFTAHSPDARKSLVRRFVPNPIEENDAFLGRPKTRNAAFGIQCSEDENATVDVTRLDRDHNDIIRQRSGVAAVAEKLREARLRWLMDIDKYTIRGDFFLSVHVDLSLLETERTRRVPSDSL
ncbi:unnamed protein product [Heligmosomoides polygyrus]|uniref:MATH domain-containing protein n=1 Tax=Heligmosomoides polygyrus TaxID=6339 RepID=A0A3P7YBI3_HELPZ|nr:unnamed protein product [Heligmosomoides polygyrus]